MHTEKKYNELEIITFVSKGDEKAFVELFDHYRDKIYGVALKLTRTATLAEEIVEDVFLKIWLKRADLLKIENFSAYLFIITRNHVYRSLKQIANNYQTVELIENSQSIASDNIEDYVIGREYDSLLHDALSHLPKQQRQVYSLIKEHGLKREEAAVVLHLKPETIKFHLAEAMKNIRSFCIPYLDTVPFVAFVLFYSS